MTTTLLIIIGYLAVIPFVAASLIRNYPSRTETQSTWDNPSGKTADLVRVAWFWPVLLVVKIWLFFSRKLKRSPEQK